MWLDTSSTTTFAVLPSAVFYDPAGRLGVVFSPEPRRRRGAAVRSTSTSISIEELSLPIAEGRVASALAAEGPDAGLDKPRAATMELSKRIQFLKVESEIDRVPFSDASLADFQAFLRDIGPRARPSLFLNDNGNLRALWKNDQREQIGLQFLGDGNIQFVIFKQRGGALKMARVAGIDAKDKIFGHIKASGAEGLLFG
jgi:hypothetical protein